MTLFVGVSNAADKNQFVEGYAQAAYELYAASTQQAVELDQLIQAFVQNPTELNLAVVKNKWIDARKVYSQTEVYRFFDGPIDDANGPEGLINAWPLDEVYIDYVVGQPNSGIVNDVVNYPVISEELLMELNEKDGEANISTGWHAIEFLLWGQDSADVSLDIAGTRPYTDYTTAPNADRRGQYLSVASQLLVKHLQYVTEAWNPANKTGFATGFVANTDSFTKVIEAAKFLAGEELAMERMFVAYEAQLQEDEHSCFSDTTNFDVYYNYVGIRKVLMDKYNGVSFYDLVAAQDAQIAQEMLTTILDLEAKFVVFSALRFDQAIYNNRVEMKAIIDQLRVLADQIGAGLAVVK